MPPGLVLDRQLLHKNALKSHSLRKKPFMASKPIHAALVREPRPAQFALGGSALEWQGYRALCSRMQQAEASGSTAADRSKKGPGASTPDP
jgi:hypothetical protein